MITLDAVYEAQVRVGPHLRRTPLLPSAWLSERIGADVRLKLESLQISSSFKVRGALNALMRLAESSRGMPPTIVTASAGNHGRAIAWAAQRLGLRAVVFTPKNAPRAKLDPIARHGADLRAIADDYEGAEREALAFAQATGARFVSPYNHEDVIAGAGTVALEVTDEWPDVDQIVVPVGGGGLISGIAVAAKRRTGIGHPGGSTRPRVIGVEVEASPAFSAARRAGHLVTITVDTTLADGLGGNVEPGSLTWEYLRDLVDDVVTVSEAELRNALRELVAQDHLIAEGAGIVGVAAVLAGRVAAAPRTAIVLSGSNIDAGKLASVISSPH